nr:PREDICTED: GTPase IMAP family member 8 [Rhinolophus sinicus]
MSELRVLLVGKRGAGKSTFGNSLLGKRVFDTRFSDKSVTQTLKSESRIWKGKKFCIIDSPDLSYLMKSELSRHISPGPHAFLLVTPLGSYSKQDERVLHSLQSSFGNKCFEFMIILLTRKEDLGDQEVDSVLKTRHADVSELIKKCQSRYSVFNYREKAEYEHQVAELLQKLESMVGQNEYKPCTFQNTLTLVLVGRSGTGKSATGNTILGRSEFVSQLQAQPVTKTWQESMRTWNEQAVIVVDTPEVGLLGAEGDPSQLQELIRYLSSGEGSNAIFVLVLQLGQFTQEDQMAVKRLKEIFGKEVMKHTIILFTRKEDLEDGILANYVKNTDNKALRKLMKKCEQRVYAFNNKETGQAREEQVRVLLNMASGMIKKPGAYRCVLAQENGNKKQIGLQKALTKNLKGKS